MDNRHENQELEKFKEAISRNMDTDTLRRLAETWAADDRLWTTQESVAFNLQVFGRAVLSVLVFDGTTEMLGVLAGNRLTHAPGTHGHAAEREFFHKQDSRHLAKERGKP